MTLESLALPQEVQAFAAFVNAFAQNVELLDTARKPGEKKGVLARFRALNRESRAGLKKQSKRVDTVFKEIAGRDLTPEDLASLASLALEKRQVERHQMTPVLTKLQEKLHARADLWDTEALQCLRESIEIASNLLALHQEFTNKLLKLVAERRAASGEVLRARPVDSELDHMQLTSEIIARFPKILAELAK